ncbi:unnamed protein product [Arctogadus glacialis]
MLQTPWCRGIYSLLPTPAPGELGKGGREQRTFEMSPVLFCFVWIDFFVFFIFLLSLVRSVLSMHFIPSSSALPHSPLLPCFYGRRYASTLGDLAHVCLGRGGAVGLNDDHESLVWPRTCRSNQHKTS